MWKYGGRKIPDMHSFSKLLTKFLRHDNSRLARRHRQFEDARLNMVDLDALICDQTKWSRLADNPFGLPDRLMGTRALWQVAMDTRNSKKKRLDVFVRGPDVLAVRAHMGHSVDSWIGGAHDPTAMSWTIMSMRDAFEIRFLYHGTSMVCADSIVQRGLDVGRMYAHTSGKHPWCAATREAADSQNVDIYDSRDRSNAIVIVSAAFALRAGCTIYRTQANAFLIDRVVPPEAIVGVDVKPGWSLQASMRTHTRPPPLVGGRRRPRIIQGNIFGTIGIRTCLVWVRPKDRRTPRSPERTPC